MSARPVPGIRFCRRHEYWEYRWIDPEGRPVWYRLVDVGMGKRQGRAKDAVELVKQSKNFRLREAEADERLYRVALEAAAEVYGCDQDQVENYTPDREGSAFGICVDGTEEEP